MPLAALAAPPSSFALSPQEAILRAKPAVALITARVDAEVTINSGPCPQLMVTSASTRAVMSATAGLARRMASWGDNANDDGGAASAASGMAAAAQRSLHGLVDR